MPIYVPTDGIGSAYYGADPLAAIYYGTDLVWQAGGGGNSGPISFLGSAMFADDAIGTFNFSSLQDTGGSAPTIQEYDIIIAIFAAGSSSNRPDSVMAPTGYTLAHSDLVSTAGAINANLQISYKIMGPTPDTSFAYVATGGTNPCRSMVVYALRGVDATTPLDVATTIASGTGTGAANPPTITPANAGAWIVVAGTYCEAGDRILFTNPGDLSSTSNHFRSILGADGNRDSAIGTGLKTNWSSGAFDPSTLSGGSADAGATWCAATMALRSAP